MGSDPVVRGEVSTVSDGPEYDLNLREHPTRYVPTPDERGVFKIQPYKDELLPHWSIASLDAATDAIDALRDQERTYRAADDFVGVDMVRKYLRMGWTRSLRYAKYPGGQKTGPDGTTREPEEWYDEEKREIARRYRTALDDLLADEAFAEWRDRWPPEDACGGEDGRVMSGLREE